jgi:hypothetical protein
MMIGDLDVYSAMQTGNPYKSYRKTILGKVFVDVWDNFNNKPKEVGLFGNPENAIIDIWSEKENQFFKNINKKLFDDGLVIEVDRAKLPPQPEVKVYSDEELSELLKTKFFKLRSILNNLYNDTTLTRLLDIAREMEASEKTIKTIEARLSELKTAEFTKKDDINPDQP